MTTIIEIASIHPPKEGKKVATVVSNTGQSFEIWPEKMTGLKEGGSYEVEIKEREWNSRTIRQIVKAKPAEPAPAANGNAKTIPISTTAPADTEATFVARILGAAIVGGHVKMEARDLAQATTLLRMLWSSQFGDGLNTFHASEAQRARG